MSGEKIKTKFIIGGIVLVVIALGLWCIFQFSSELRFTAPASVLKIVPEQKVDLVIVGDMMFDRNVRNKIDKIGFDTFFEGVKELLTNADVTIGNLEGPFTTYPSKTASLKSKELVFTFDPALAPKLAEVGFDILGLANNHTYNFGREGFAMTKQYISETGMVSYGDPNNKEALSVMMEKNGIKIGIVGFHEFSYVNFDKVLAEIDLLRPAVDFLIVTPHWGIEYQKEPTELMRTLAYKWIDRGADVIIGAHPHVIGNIEEYNSKKIFYSLGNFVFDQYFSKETSEGLVVKIAATKQDDKIDLLYTWTRVNIGRDGVTVSESD